MIYIGKNIRIGRLDENCLHVEVQKESTNRGTKEKAMKWQRVGYYGTLTDALIAILKKQVSDLADEELQIHEVLDRVAAAEHNVLEIAKSIKEGDL